jgi:hypothetical protein
MKIIMRSTGAVLDVHPDMNIEMKRTSPIFSENGSQTISDSLPATVGNNRELSFPGKTEASEKKKNLFPVILESDSFQQAGELQVLGVAGGDISFNIGTDESTMYAMMKTKVISELDVMPEPYEPGGENPLANIITHLQQTRDDPDAPLTVFPVVVEDKESGGKRYLTVLNQSINVTDYATGIQWAARKIPQIIDGTVASIDVPAGYGVAPFVKVWKILEIIFQNFGFQIAENAFRSHPQLKLLTCLHSCIDSICFGKIDYRQIVPEETVENFLNALHNKFGAVFFVSSTGRSIKIKLLKDILAAAEYTDITALKSGDLSWKQTEQKQIRLKMKTGLDTAAPPSESYSEFMAARKNSVQKVVNYEGTPIGDASVEKYKTLYSVSSGMYYRQIETAASGIKRELLGSDFFDWDQKTKDVEYQEYSAEDESVPLMYLASEYPAYLPRYITGISHKNTMLVNVQEKKDEKKAPLAFLFYFGRPQESTGDLKHHFYVASPFCESFTGTPPQDAEYSISLTARSLYSHFWKEFDAVLRHANREYEGEFNLSKSGCAGFDFSSRLMVDGQLYLPAELDFAFSGSIPKLILRSLKLMAPYDTDQDEYSPPLGEKTFEWVYYDGIEHAAWEYIQRQYTNNPDERDTYRIVGYNRDPDQVPDDISGIDPPTENDYNGQLKIGVREYTGVLTYVHVDVSGVPASTITEIPYTVDIAYICYYYPELV